MTCHSSVPICRFFNIGRCRSGDSCPYRHELYNHENRPTCIFYLQGLCKYGDSCRFYHDNGVKKLSLPSEQPQQQQQQVNQEEEEEKKESKTSDKNEEENPHVCGICLEDVVQQQKKFGLLTHCDHVFCIDCLLSWRSRLNTTSTLSRDAIRGCPTCRKISDYIVPSTVLLKNESKSRYIEDYVSSKSVIPCRRFQKEGKCPFYHFCFYQHTFPDGSDAKPMQEIQWNQRNERKQRLADYQAIMHSLLQLHYEENQYFIEESDTDEDDDLSFYDTDSLSDEPSDDYPDYSDRASSLESF